MLLLVPSDPLNTRLCDDHFAPEATAAEELGWDVATVDHDMLTMGHPAEAVSQLRRTEGSAVYRGWMLGSDQYRALAAALDDRGVSLRTGPDAYRAAHEFPGWYELFAGHTAETVWTEGPDLEAFMRCLATLSSGAAVIKDYVKSEKHYWDEAAYVPDVADVDTAAGVARRLLELRDDSFVGGFVVRRFEHYVGPQVRSWWVNGRCVLVTPHPDQPNEPAPSFDLGPFRDAVLRLGSPFVTLDLALRNDGRWRVVEVGDGQVSDRPVTVDPKELISKLG